MRTDTATFRKNAFKAIRAQGVNSNKSKAIVAKFAYQMYAHEYPVLANGVRFLVSMEGENQQSIAMVDNSGLVMVHLDSYTLRDLQPLISTTPTTRQVEIADQLSEMIPDIYSAIEDACQAYEAEHGYPTNDAEFEARNAFTKAQPAVAEINGRYDALKAESLAINPHVQAHLVDPDKASFWYDWVKDVRGYRPQGFMTLQMVIDDMARLKNEPCYDEMDMAA